MRNIFLTLFIVLAFQGISQWEVNNLINTPVCTEFGKQNDVRILSDEHHGAFLAWKDARNGNDNPDIYVQHVDSLGYMLWENNGMAICTDTTDQSTPNLCTDGVGGFILAWSDRRNGGERDVYAQRVSSNGNILWSNNGVNVAGKPIREHNEKIASDDNGGAYIIWEQYDSLSQLWDIALQHIDASGNLLWNPNGITVTGVYSNKLNPKIQKDKNGGLFIVWQDLRNGLDYDIYAQRMDAEGNRMWGNWGISVVTMNESQINPKVDPDTLSGGIYVAWADKRNGWDYDIYAQRLDSNGVVLWNNMGQVVSAASGNQSAVDIISTTQTNGVICTWKDSRSDNYDIYAQKLLPDGASQWGMNGMLVATSTFNQINPNICSDGSDGCIITWQDSTFNDWDVYAQKINGQGLVQWSQNGEAVSNAIEIQGHPKHIPDGNGGAIFTWQDKRANQYDIYVHHLFGNGQPIQVSENNITTLEWTVYPNPFSDRIGIYSKDSKALNFTLYSAQGQGVKNFTVISGDQISMEEFPSGIYLLKEKGNSLTIRLVKN